VVRTPSKLFKLLGERDVSEETVKSQLSIETGNIKDSSSVQTVLVKDGRLVDIIIFGVGAYPVMTNPLKPTLEDPTICQDGMASVVTALEAIRAEHVAANKPWSPPTLIAMSTTGMAQKRDLPWAMYPLYKWLLEVPHRDKKVMEDKLMAATEDGLLKGMVVRASLLTDGASLGLKSVREGAVSETPTGQPPKEEAGTPAIGYTISRRDVGGWIYHRVIQDETHGADKIGKYVTVTY
jgi:hypothetical protein